jgi:hypothetical protein
MKEMVSKLKKAPIEWEKIFARIYRELKKLNSPKNQ